MSIDSMPTMPAHRWAQRPAGVHPWGPAGLPQPWPVSPPGPGTPSNAWAGPVMPGRPAVAPPWPQPLPAGDRPSRRNGILLGIGVLVIALAALIGLVAATGAGGPARPAVADRTTPAAGPANPPSPPPPPPAVPSEALPGLLLDPAAVNAIMGTRDLVVNPKLTTAKLYIDTTDKPECGGVWANANSGAYAGSGWEAVQTQYLREQDRPHHEVYQSVVSFPTAQTAKDFVAGEAKRWPLCTGKAITTTVPDTTAQTWWIAAVAQQGDMLTSVSTAEGGRGYTCQHALTARDNVVVDAVACGWDVTQQGTTVAQRIGEQISRTL
jgi:serine/threonine kinase PknH